MPSIDAMRLPVQGVWLLAVPFAALAAALTGCTPAVGDSCALSTDCATDGTRICDTSEPGGYCTVLNCTGNSLGSVCPDNALCVLFNPNIPGCPYSAHAPAPTGTAQCRGRCARNSDCRADYVCAIPTSAPWNAKILDTDQAQAVCLPALVFVDGGKSPVAYGYSGPPDAEPPVCQAAGPTFDAGFPPADAGVDAAPEAAPDGGAKGDGASPDAGARDGSADAKVDSTLDASHAETGAPDGGTADGGAHDAAKDALDGQAAKDAVADAPDAG